MYMEDIRVFEKKEKKNIWPGYKNGIQHKQMCHAHNKKEKINNGKNRTPKSGKNQNRLELVSIYLTGLVSYSGHKIFQGMISNS